MNLCNYKGVNDSVLSYKLNANIFGGAMGKVFYMPANHKWDGRPV